MHARCASAGSKHEPIVGQPRGKELERGPEREWSRARRASQIEQPQVRVHGALRRVRRHERALAVGRKRETGESCWLADTPELFALAVEPRESGIRFRGSIDERLRRDRKEGAVQIRTDSLGERGSGRRSSRAAARRNAARRAPHHARRRSHPAPSPAAATKAAPKPVVIRRLPRLAESAPSSPT